MAEDKWADWDYVLVAVKQDGNALEYADDSLKADREIVLAAVHQDSSALRFASEELQNNQMLKRMQMAFERIYGAPLKIEGWNPFIDVNRVANALRHGEKADIPPAILACFNSLCACELSDHWLDVINGDYALDSDFLLLTKNKLLEAGFRDENISLCIGSIIASAISNHIDFADIIEISAENNADKIITKCAMYLLSGYIGPPDIEILYFILSLDESDQCLHSSKLRRLLKLTFENDEPSRRELILSVVPLWKNLIDSPRFEGGTWEKALDFPWEEKLGFPFEHAMLLEEPSDLVVLGDIFYDSSAYELAYFLMARSALLGNKKAWDHLSQWLSDNADNYEPNKILEALIKAGKQGLSHNSEM